MRENKKNNFNGIKTDIEWLKKTLEDMEEKIDKINNTLLDLQMFKVKVMTFSLLLATIISFTINTLVKLIK